MDRVGLEMMREGADSWRKTITEMCYMCASSCERTTAKKKAIKNIDMQVDQNKQSNKNNKT